MNDPRTVFLAFLTSLAIGLLVGLERERHPESKAGVRTFALISLSGALCSLLGEKAGSAWVLVAGLLACAGGVLSAYRADGDANWDSGTTTVVAAIVTYCLGAATWYGYDDLAVSLAIVVTVLLHFKTEIEGFSIRLTPKDIASVLQFAVLSLVILPVVPNEGFGPYGAFNPYHLWMMVVLISAVSLAGYLAWRLAGGRAPTLLLGALGGLVSSTATTLVYARGARGHPELEKTAATVLLLANLMVLLRITVLATVVEPRLLMTLAPVLAAGLVAALPIAWYTWRRHQGEAGFASPELTNPTDLKVALGLGAAYALILLLGSWLNDTAGARGLYGLAFASGLTDVDAISLSSMRLFGDASITAGTAASAIVVALCSNVIVKAAIAFVVGGVSLGRQCLAGFAAMGAALAVAAYLLPA